MKQVNLAEGRWNEMSKQKRRDPLKVMIAWTVVFAVLAVGTWAAGTLLTSYRRARRDTLAARVEETNTRRQQEYQLALAEFNAQQAEAKGANLQWPTQKSEGWDVIDLTNYPLENPYTVTATRADAMHGGLLLVNEWHSRPDDFDESVMASIFSYAGDRRTNFGVQNSSQRLHPAAIEAIIAALTDAKALGLEHFVINYAYRSYDDQNALFQNKIDEITKAYGDRYQGEALIARAKRDVNYPGTSEFNTGMSVTLYLYQKGNDEVNKQSFSTSQQGVWLYENSWKYGLIFRFPRLDYPLPGVADKTYKNGMSQPMNCYR